MTHRSQDPFDDVPDLRRDRPVGGGEGSFGRQPVPAVYRRRRWATVGVLVVVLVTLVVLVRAVAGGTGDAGNSGDSAATPDNDAAAMASVSGTGEATPGPIPGVPTSDDVGSLPPGGKVTDKGRGTWRGV
ncbi:MAG TPA: hypothetical protein DCM55_00815, partial [Corynebacterium variabile]|nr:hypothetical protein [Corynebacterium variabile]